MNSITLTILFVFGCVSTSFAQLGFNDSNIRQITDPLELRDELLTRARYIINLVAGEVKLLKFENKFLQADGLTRELELIIEVSHELRATEVANVTTAEVRRLDERLLSIEDRISRELTQLGKQFITRFEIQQIIAFANQLLERVSDTVKRLNAAGRGIEARGLESEERQLLQLSILLRATQDTQELRRIEELLVERMYVISGMLNDIDLSGLSRRKRELVKRHHKPDVLKSIEDLLAIADKAVVTLQSQNRTQGVALIQQTERELRALGTRLNATENETIVVQIEEQVAIVSYRLIEELRVVGLPLSVNEIRDQLLTAAQYLIDRAELTTNQLKAQNRTHDITTLNNSINTLKDLVTQVKNAANEADLRQLENRLAQEELLINSELTRLSMPVVSLEEAILLVRKAEELSIKILVKVRSLRNQGKLLLAEGLMEEERELVTLEALLLTAVFPEEITRVEVRLKNAETRIEAELAKIP